MKLKYLRANGFKTFIVSGGDISFMRVWAEKAYGIPPQQVIGSNQVQIPLDQFAKGIYFLRLKGSSTFTKKVIVE